ncbi:hypothetical protein [Kocuria soli]|uniref:hypothetical protein n=1 Tax=Kocuria soli TaxID=2485125 RepID=UPI000F50E7D1|nr:hypothetical protein [Kocuria soli]
MNLWKKARSKNSDLPKHERGLSARLEATLYPSWSRSDAKSAMPWVDREGIQQEIHKLTSNSDYKWSKSQIFKFSFGGVLGAIVWLGVSLAILSGTLEPVVWFDRDTISAYMYAVYGAEEIYRIPSILIALVGIQVTFVIATALQELPAREALSDQDSNQAKLEPLQAFLGVGISVFSCYFLVLEFVNALSGVINGQLASIDILRGFIYAMLFSIAFALMNIRRATPLTRADQWGSLEEYHQRYAESMSKLNKTWSNMSWPRRVAVKLGLSAWGFVLVFLTFVIPVAIILIGMPESARAAVPLLIPFEVLIGVWCFFWRYYNTVGMPDGNNPVGRTMDNLLIVYLLVSVGVSLVLMMVMMIGQVHLVLILCLGVHGFAVSVVAWVRQRASPNSRRRINGRGGRTLRKVDELKFETEVAFDKLSKAREK